MAQTTREELRELMRLKGVSVRGIARDLNLSPAFVSDVLLGRRNSERITSHLRSRIGMGYERRDQPRRRLPERRAG